MAGWSRVGKGSQYNRAIAQWIQNALGKYLKYAPPNYDEGPQFRHVFLYWHIELDDISETIFMSIQTTRLKNEIFHSLTVSDPYDFRWVTNTGP